MGTSNYLRRSKYEINENKDVMYQILYNVHSYMFITLNQLTFLQQRDVFKL